VSRIASPGGVRQRDPRVRDKAYLGFIAGLPCVDHACRGQLRKPVEVCHIKVGFPLAGWRAFGHAEKAHDRRTVPLCSECHRTGPRAQHANLGGDERTFWERLGVYPPAFCAALVEAYEEKTDGAYVISSAARGSFPFPPDS
jgi:hypothetical protein